MGDFLFDKNRNSFNYDYHLSKMADFIVALPCSLDIVKKFGFDEMTWT